MRCHAKLLLPVLAFAFTPLLIPRFSKAQEEPTLDAIRRRFPEVGAGFRAIRRAPDGSYYVLVSPAPAAADKRSKRTKVVAANPPMVLVFDAEGRKLRQIPDQAGQLVSPTSLDVDTAGRIYIADESANTVSVYTSEGKLAAHFGVPEPLQVIALPHDQFAVSSGTAEHLIAIYDLHGTRLREIGELLDLSEDPEINQRINQGFLAVDPSGTLYFAFHYAPEPTVRKYDASSGALVDELSLTTLDLAPMAQSARQQIARMTSGKSGSPHEIISAIGIDAGTQELWVALGNVLMHFDSADNQTSSGRVYTTDGARMVPSFILAEKDALLLGNDPLGIYEYARNAGKIRTAR